LATLLPGADVAEREASLELSTPTTEPARLISATIIEGSELRAIPVGAPIVARSSARSSSAVNRVASAVNRGPIGAGGVARTIAPESLPRYLAKSASDPIETIRASPVSLPVVPGVNARGYPITG